MDHIAILKKGKVKEVDNLLRDILNGSKTIESRWYVNKTAPWDKVKTGDSVYFKESGCPVSACAKVEKLIQIENLTEEKIKDIIKKYGKQIAPNASTRDFLGWTDSLRNKNYCILVFLQDVRKLEPFNINKSGFGVSCAWLVVDDVGKIIIKPTI